MFYLVTVALCLDGHICQNALIGILKVGEFSQVWWHTPLILALSSRILNVRLELSSEITSQRRKRKEGREGERKRNKGKEKK